MQVTFRFFSHSIKVRGLLECVYGNTSLSLRFSSDFLVSTKYKAVFAVASFRNSSAQFF